MSDNLWKRIGIKRNSSSEQNFSEGSTQNLVRCLENLKHYSQNQELGANSSGPIKNSQNLKSKSQLVTQFINKVNNQELYIEQCETVRADSSKSQNEVEGKQLQIKKQYANLKRLRQFVSNLIAQFQYFKQNIRKQLSNIHFSAFIAGFNDLLSKASRSTVNIQKLRNSQDIDYQKCSKCKNSQKLVQLLTKQCWTLEQHIKQLKNVNKNSAIIALKSQNQRIQQQNNKLVKRFEQSLKQMQKQKMLLCKDLALKNIKISELQTKNTEVLNYFKEQIDQLKNHAFKKIEQLSFSNRKFQAKLQLSQDKYIQLSTKYQMMKELNVDIQIQKKSVERSNKLYRSTKFLQLPEYKEKGKKKYSSEIDEQSIFEDRSPSQKPQTNLKSFFRSSLKIPNFETSIYREASFYEGSSGAKEAFQRLDELQRQVQRKTKESKLRSK